MMSTDTPSPIFKQSALSQRFTVITIMFLSVLLGLLIYTITTLQKDKSNAFLIDVAGRQRMLLQKHVSEVFLTSQGITADFASTRDLIRSTLKALMDGGSVQLHPETHQQETITAVPTKEILEKLREQKKYIEHIFQLADHFLLLKPDHLDYRPQLQTLRTQHTLAIRTADEAVKKLDENSEEILSTMVQREVLITIIDGILGIFITAKGIRNGRKLENEIAERKRVESALRENEIFMSSIVENIPDMIFVKTAKDLRFVRLNKAFEELVACSRKECLGNTDYDIFPN